MGKYNIGVDISNGSDYSAYTIVKHCKIRWYHHWFKKLHLIKHLPAPFKVIDTFIVPPKPKEGDK